MASLLAHPESMVISSGSVTNKYKSPCGAEGEEKARYPQGREWLNESLCADFTDKEAGTQQVGDTNGNYHSYIYRHNCLFLGNLFLVSFLAYT